MTTLIVLGVTYLLLHNMWQRHRIRHLEQQFLLTLIEHHDALISADRAIDDAVAEKQALLDILEDDERHITLSLN